MQSLFIDNAEIKNTLKHIDNKFERVNDGMKSIKSIATEVATDADEVKSDNRLLNTRATELEYKLNSYKSNEAFYHCGSRLF